MKLEIQNAGNHVLLMKSKFGKVTLAEEVEIYDKTGETVFKEEGTPIDSNADAFHWF